MKERILVGEQYDAAYRNDEKMWNKRLVFLQYDVFPMGHGSGILIVPTQGFKPQCRRGHLFAAAFRCAGTVDLFEMGCYIRALAKYLGARARMYSKKQDRGANGY